MRVFSGFVTISISFFASGFSFGTTKENFSDNMVDFPGSSAEYYSCEDETSTAANCAAVSAAKREEPSRDFVFAALGDSVSTGFNSYSYGDYPEISWATGTSPDINSHATRLQAKMPSQNIVTVNVAESGAETKNLSMQLDSIDVTPDYVTILMGGNDACDWSGSNDSLYDEVGNNVDNAIKQLVEKNDKVKILVVPVPDIYQLWEMGHTKASCRLVWSFAGMCKNLLPSRLAQSDRLNFRENVKQINLRLQEVANKWKNNVRYDLSLGSVTFAPNEISTLDCFHPSMEGQEKISRLSWATGWFK